jgi:hypothetical protein
MIFQVILGNVHSILNVLFSYSTVTHGSLTMFHGALFGKYCSKVKKHIGEIMALEFLE